jgi:threonine/homoserine/homoserine lactone efflux protein
MSADLLLALVGFALAGSLTPGPNNLLVLTSGINHGFSRTLPLIGGISIGFVAMLIIIGFGLGSAVQSHASLNLAFKIAGLCYMLWLAWKIATSAPEAEAASAEAPARPPLSAVEGALFQWVNPKAWAVAVSATAAFAAPSAPWSGLGWISGVFLVVALLSLSAWAAFGTLMRELVDTPGRMRAFNIAMATLLIASALPVAMDVMQTLRGAP